MPKLVRGAPSELLPGQRLCSPRRQRGQANSTERGRRHPGIKLWTELRTDLGCGVALSVDTLKHALVVNAIHPLDTHCHLASVSLACAEEVIVTPI